MPGLGYAIDAPPAVAARENPRNWSFELLVPRALPVPDDFDADCGPTLNQEDSPECTAFSATAVRSFQERLDEGAWRFSSASAHLAYQWLKHGHGAYPGDGYAGEGSFPVAVWQLARSEGIPAADGLPRRIAAYYQLQGTPSSATWIDLQIQVILAYGPVTISSGWPGNWWTCPTSGLLPAPSGYVGGHMVVRKGWTLAGPVGTLASGRSPSGRYWRQRQSWGTYGRTDAYGRTGEFLIPFEGDGAWDILTINEIWKTIDLDDAPTPGGADVVPATDATPRLLSVPPGTQLYSPTTNAPVVKLGGTAPARVYSPCSASSTQFLVRISTGGVPQLLRVAKSAVTIISASPIT